MVDHIEETPDSPFGLDMSKIKCIRQTSPYVKPVCCHIVKKKEYIPKYKWCIPKIDTSRNCERSVGLFSCMITDGNKTIVFCGNHYNQKIPITFKSYYESRGFNYNLQLSICANLWCYTNNINPLVLTDINHWIVREMIGNLNHKDCTLFRDATIVDIYTDKVEMEKKIEKENEIETRSRKRSRDTYEHAEKKYTRSEVHDKSPFVYGQYTTFPNMTHIKWHPKGVACSMFVNE